MASDQELADEPLPEGDDEIVEAEGPTIFVADPTVEAARIEWALRARGYVVIDVPLAMLVGRAAVQKPHLVLLDVDARSALEVAARLRALPGGGSIHLIYAGHPGQTFANGRDALAHEGSGFFARPIDVDALVEKIDALLGVVDDAPPGRPSPLLETGHRSVPPSSRPQVPRRSSRPPPPPPPSLRAPLSPLPPRPPLPIPPGAISIAPPTTHRPELRAGEEAPSSQRGGASSEAAGRGWSARAAEVRLSPDLERLLREAEARVIGPSSQRSNENVLLADDEVLSPEDEVEAVLPAEILASLDEPLDLGGEDDEGSSADTGTPRGPTTGQARRSQARAAPQTTGGGATGVGVALDLSAGTNAGEGTSSGGIEAALTTAGGRIEQDLRGSEQLPTPRPPRRAPAHTDPRAITSSGPDVDDDDERSLSQVSMQMAMPRPASEHPPPLAPITARPAPPPRAVDVALPAPPSPPREELYPRAAPSPPSVPPPPLAHPVAALPAARPIISSDDALRAFAEAVATRVTGVLRLDEAAGIRRVVLQDGDVVTAASSVEGESLLGYLQGRGDIAADVVKKLEGRVPPFGRLAGAALVAHGHVHQDQLWDVLQAHAAWLLTRAIGMARGQIAFEREPPARLKGEPPVFGGTPGPALIVEITRRAVPPAEAIGRMGGLDVRLASGERSRLIDECGLEDADDAVVRRAAGASLRDVLGARGDDAAPLVYALVALGVLTALAAARAPASSISSSRRVDDEPSVADEADPVRDAELDDSALRSRIGVRRALVEDGDYFAILGVPRIATGYEIRRAYIELRRALDPSRILRPSLGDLVDDLHLVLQVLDEAYDVLKDATRRDRYRRAISHEPPAH